MTAERKRLGGHSQGSGSAIRKPRLHRDLSLWHARTLEPIFPQRVRAVERGGIELPAALQDYQRGETLPGLQQREVIQRYGSAYT